MKTLGIIIDQQFASDAQCAALLAKSRTRQSILTNIAHRKWGVETAVPRITHDALINRLLRYGMNILGSCLPEDLIDKLDVHVINPAARRITGLDAKARIEVLHFLAGAHTYKNLYTCHAASFMRSALMANGSQIRTRFQQDLCALLNTETFKQTRKEI